MKHSASREMYAYWTARRGTRLAPNRSEIDPAAIRGLLGDSFMVNRERGAETVFRLAGTRICDMFGRELKGERFLALWDARSHEDICMLLDVAAESAQGFVAGVTAELDDGAPVRFELLMLPLYRAGSAEARSIGTLAPFNNVHNLQLQSVSGLRLEGWRQVGPDIEASLVPRDFAMPPEAHVSHGMIVVPGGRV
jgi:hypothetical protein